MKITKVLIRGLLLSALGVSSLLLAQVPADWPPDWNGSGAFGKPWATQYDVSSLKYTQDEVRHIETASLFYHALHTGNWDLALTQMTPGEIDHNPNEPKSPQELMELLAAWHPDQVVPARALQGYKDQDPSLLLTDRHNVLIMWDAQVKNPDGTTYPVNRFELLRFNDNGKIAEHWDIANRRENAQPFKVPWCQRSGHTDCPRP